MSTDSTFVCSSDPALQVNIAFVDDTMEQTIGDSSLSSNTTTNPPSESNAAKDVSTILIVIGIVTAILIVLIATVVIALVLFRRKSTQLKPDYDGSYSTLNREKIEQMKSQPLHTPTELYDQIQLSPSTGQAEFISNTECENINNTLTPSTHVIHPCVNKEQPAYPNSGIPQTTSSNLSPHKKESTSEQPTYAVVDKKGNRGKKREEKSQHKLRVLQLRRKQIEILSTVSI